jgi:sugar/nucleoside kinase (ribokinase family)
MWLPMKHFGINSNRYKQIFAVAHRSDTIFIYDLNRERKKAFNKKMERHDLIFGDRVDSSTLYG